MYIIPIKRKGKSSNFYDATSLDSEIPLETNKLKTEA